MKRLAALALLILLGIVTDQPEVAQAACQTQSVSVLGSHVTYENSCTENDEEIIVTGDLSVYDVCSIVSTTGAVDLLVSLDGEVTYTTVAMSFLDKGAVDTVPVNVTAAGTLYAFPVVFTHLKVLQNGATDAAVILRCSDLY